MESTWFFFILPSFVRLFQITLAQTHSKQFQQHCGYAKIENILHIPFHVIAERENLAASVAVATNPQIGGHYSQISGHHP